MTAEKEYKKLHEWRVRLLLAGMLTGKENENIKKKTEAFGKKQRIPIVSEYLATLSKVNKIKAKAINNQ